MSIRTISVSSLAVVFLLSAGHALAGGERQAQVGERVSTPAGTVKVDTSSGGDRTVRGTGNAGPSVTFGGERPSRENPKGDTRVTVGVTLEF